MAAKPASDDLIEILADYRAAPDSLKLIHHEKRILSRRVRLFMAWLTKNVAEQLKLGVG